MVIKPSKALAPSYCLSFEQKIMFLSSCKMCAVYLGISTELTERKTEKKTFSVGYQDAWDIENA